MICDRSREFLESNWRSALWTARAATGRDSNIQGVAGPVVHPNTAPRA